MKVHCDKMLAKLHTCEVHLYLYFLDAKISPYTNTVQSYLLVVESAFPIKFLKSAMLLVMRAS